MAVVFVAGPAGAIAAVSFVRAPRLRERPTWRGTSVRTCAPRIEVFPPLRDVSTAPVREAARTD
jgi:hypothetical protein